MIRYSVKTNKSPEKVLEEAKGYFAQELGLKATTSDDCCVSFEGGGGFVTVTVSEENEAPVDIVTREWDYQVRQFMGRIN